MPYLKYLVESDNAGERAMAVQTLANLGPDAEDYLRTLADDVEYTVRYQARAALQQLK